MGKKFFDYTELFNGKTYTELDEEEKKEYARKALAINNSNKNASELLTYVIEQENTEKMDKAMELYDKQHYTQALSLLNIVISQDNKDSNAYYYRAMVYDAQKKIFISNKWLQKSIRKNHRKTSTKSIHLLI